VAKQYKRSGLTTGIQTIMRRSRIVLASESHFSGFRFEDETHWRRFSSLEYRKFASLGDSGITFQYCRILGCLCGKARWIWI